MPSGTYKSIAKRRPVSRSGGKASAKAAASLSNSDLLSSLGPSKALPNGVRQKMEGSFGMSLSDVKLFESPVVSQNGAEAAASGKNIAFAPGRLNLSSASGQQLLGHELSHVASQARGEVTGHGYLKNSSLEHKADIEGAKAASGEKLYSAGGLTPMSTDTGLTSAPMQAKESKNQRKNREFEESSIMKAYGSRDLAGQVEMMRQLAFLNSVSNTAATKAESNVYGNLTSQFTPDMATEAMRQQAGYSSQLVALRDRLQQANAGQAQTNYNGRTKTQAEADRDYATLMAKQSGTASIQQAYSTLLFNANMAVPDNEALVDRENAFRQLPNPDNVAANDIMTTDYKKLKYTMGDAGDSYVTNSQIAQENGAAAWQRPWRQKRPWWRFW